MDHKKRILAAIQHQPLDRFPTDIWATPEVWKNLRQHLGVSENIQIFDQLEIDGIMEIAPPYIGPVLRQEDEMRVNEWGMRHQKIGYESGFYEEQVYFPLAKAETIADLQDYTWPSPDWYDYSALPGLAEQYQGRAILCGYTAAFYFHNLLCGLELSLMDPLLRPEFARYLIGRLSDFFNEYHKRCFEAGKGIIDLTQVTDDFGSRSGLLVSPKIFDQFYRQSMQRGIDLAHAYKIAVFHHNDGDMRPLLPRLVEMGNQVLNPIQWRWGDWDLAAVKSMYGQQLCFHGGVDNQHTLPFGGPKDVQAEIQRLKNTLGADGTGLIIAPCHNIQAITPVENIIALYKAAHGWPGKLFKLDQNLFLNLSQMQIVSWKL